MNSDPFETSNKKHQSILRGRFAHRLLDCAPRSVLDLGCGHGELLSACRDAGIPAVGIEPNAQTIHSLKQAGHETLKADAASLPIPDSSFDWVVLRHILHHMADPGATLAEAVRVARSGILLAEPWFDANLASQAVALDLDRWLKTQDRLAGQIHFENLGSNDIIKLLPPGQVKSIECEHYLTIRPRPEGWVAHEASSYLANIPKNDTALDTLAALQERAEKTGISAPGTLILTITLSTGP